jgi:transglutaminase-like putative cysteine protease
VRVDPRPAPAGADPWTAVRDALERHIAPEALEAVEFVFDSPYVAAEQALADYAAPSFAPGRPVLEAVTELSHRIHTEFTYAPKSTAVDTPLLEVLAARRGVCQDFSHVMIGALRSLGLAARYVSGYLRSGEQYLGAEASHAWVSVWLGQGWVDFDPTNDVRPDTNHVTLAWGRDYGDVAPVNGIALGGGAQTIEVDVRVEPVPESMADSMNG